MRTIAFIAMLIITLNCHAEEPFLVYGVGVQSCGQYIEQRRTPDTTYNALIATWFFGFASGHNFFSKRPKLTQRMDAETILVYLDKECRDNPLSSVGVGAINLIKTYEKELRVPKKP